jgi:hypothetical protein
MNITKDLRVAAAPVDIRTRDLPNGNLRRYSCANPIEVNCSVILGKFPEFSPDAECSVLSLENPFPQNRD